MIASMGKGEIQVNYLHHQQCLRQNVIHRVPYLVAVRKVITSEKAFRTMSLSFVEML